MSYIRYLVRKMEKDQRLNDLKTVYDELDENKKIKVEKLAIGLMEVQNLVNQENLSEIENMGVENE